MKPYSILRNFLFCFAGTALLATASCEDADGRVGWMSNGNKTRPDDPDAANPGNPGYPGNPGNPGSDAGACASGSTRVAEDGCTTCACIGGQWECTNVGCATPAMCPPSRLPLRDDLVCIQVVVWARHPKTQECCEYGDPCLAPAGWQTFFTEDECKGPSVCPAPRPEAENEICLTVNAWARDPVTQACCSYPTPCHAPRGWPQFSNEAECRTAPVSCDPRAVPPGSAKTDCPAGQVPRVIGDVFGACVFIESCTCSGPEECPQPDLYTCGASGHCERID